MHPPARTGTTIASDDNKPDANHPGYYHGRIHDRTQQAPLHCFKQFR